MRAAFYTLGCKVNQYETGALSRQFAAAGYEIVAADEEADVYVVNSCTVTAEGDRKSRQILRRMKRRNPAAVTCLTGCFPQAFPDIAQRIPEADVITGSRDRAGLLGAVERSLGGEGRVIAIVPHQKGEAFEPMQADLSARTRAFLKIEDGCDRYCAYCIIPTARGPVRSKPLAELGEELASLADAGYREVVLVGINLSSYGRDLGLGLLDAVRAACAVPGIQRVRLGSLEPELLTDQDIQAMAALPKVCPQFHLSLQSGCDATLDRMRRHYDTGEYRRIVASLRRAFPGCAITTDLMAGFPGETEEEFGCSLAFAEEIGFAKVHVFAYSPRPGTRAADMPGQIPQEQKRRRAKEMAAVTQATRNRFLLAQRSSRTAVLAEQRETDGRWEGFTPNYTPVLFESGEELAGKLVPVEITGVEGDRCVGVMTGSPFEVDARVE